MLAAVAAWAQSSAPPSKPCVADADDPGRPVLRRGKPATRKPVCDGPPAVNEPNPLPPEAAAEAEAERAAVNLSLIDRARLKAAEFTDKLPNFICDQVIRRHTSGALKDRWKLRDTVTVEVMFVDGKEDYRNAKRNGKPVEWMATQQTGAWSEGEYGRTLAHVMSPGIAEFTPGKNDTIDGVETEIHNYVVPLKRSGWTLSFGGQTMRPKFRGRVWIDPADLVVRRLEMDAIELPVSFPIDHAEMTVDFGRVKIGDAWYVLPVRSANLACFRGESQCSKNEIEFRNYRKFSAESTISTVESNVTFGPPEGTPPPAKKK